MGERKERIQKWIDNNNLVARQNEVLRSNREGENEYLHPKRKRSRKEESFGSDVLDCCKEEKTLNSICEGQNCLYGNIHPKENCCCAAENRTSEFECGINDGGKKVYCCDSPHEGRKLVDVELQMSVDKLFNLVFTESSFYQEFHQARNSSDIEQTPWEVDPETGQKKKRVVLTVSLGQSIGPKSSRVTENYVMLKCSSPGHLYSLDLSAYNSGFPYSDAFYCFSHFCLQDTTNTQTLDEKNIDLDISEPLSSHQDLSNVSSSTCHFSVYSQLIFTKSVWVMKAMIEKSSWLGLEEFYDSLVSKLKLECDNYASKESPRRRKHGIAGSKIAEAIKDKIDKDLSTRRPTKRKKRSKRYIGINTSKMLAAITVALLAILNLFLYYELTNIEALSRKSSSLPSKIDLASLRDDPSTHEEWLKFSEKLIEFDDAETESWINDVQETVNLLLRVEDVLKNLTKKIPMEIKHKALLRSLRKYSSTTNDAETLR